ncbi:MAG: hypothetical protein JWO52_1737 [Gammaproteobacteria bacterium]|jgi:hypothetical protein|nr:hypothetical protein [Gammaproteobacteria bacterium]
MSVAEPRRESLHDDGCTRRRAVATEPADARCWCTWSVCARRGRPRPASPPTADLGACDEDTHVHAGPGPVSLEIFGVGR